MASKLTQELVDYLNELIAQDRHAIQELLSLRATCGPVLAAHPSVQVEAGAENSTFTRPGEFRVGVLGLLNGFLPSMTYRGFALPSIQPYYEQGVLVRVEPVSPEAFRKFIDENIASINPV